MSVNPTNEDTLGLTPHADCSQCHFQSSLLAAGTCRPGYCSVKAEKGDQIHRFFKAHSRYASNYWQDPYWESRAIAALYLPIDHLELLLNDPDEAVRRVLAYRIPLVWLPALSNDIDREVRITVADRLPEEQLEVLADDPDYLYGSMLRGDYPSDVYFDWRPTLMPRLGVLWLNAFLRSAWACSRTIRMRPFVGLSRNAWMWMIWNY